MGRYKETYTNLYHGTTEDAANCIVSSQKFLPSSDDNWCGAGIYFYDIKSKALWAAKRKCLEQQELSGIKHKHTYVNADIVDLDKELILDLRTYSDVQQFANFVDRILAEGDFNIAGDLDSTEMQIKKRAILISFYAQQCGKKLIIGHFRQVENPKFVDVQAAAERLQLVVGVETIYCVKDSCIISNIRGAKV